MYVTSPKDLFGFYVSQITRNDQWNWKMSISWNRCYSTNWKWRMWSIYSIEYYSSVKKNKIMKFVGQWIEPDNSILSEVIQIQKGKLCIFFLSFMVLSSKSSNVNECMYWSNWDNQKSKKVSQGRWEKH